MQLFLDFRFGAAAWLHVALVLGLVVLDHDLAPLARCEVAEDLVGYLDLAVDALGALDRGLVEQQFLQTVVEAALQDRLLVIAVLGQTLDLGALEQPLGELGLYPLRLEPSTGEEAPEDADDAAVDAPLREAVAEERAR